MLPPYLTRPEYVLQPRQLWRRFGRPKADTVGMQKITPPWGFPLWVEPRPDHTVEWSLWVMGLYDLALSETLWRLTEPGETVLDVGANIGYVTSLLAARVGARGRVIAVEPNPEVYGELERHRSAWRELGSGATVELHAIALANHAGTATLRIPKRNRCEAAIFTTTNDNPNDTLRIETVPLTTGDALLPDDPAIGVLKIDIEGYELAAFQGCDRLLRHRCIRDIVYEQHEGYPSPATQYLIDRGYTIFRIWKGFWKPLLYPPDFSDVHPWEPPNYLATLDPDRARQKLRSRGWQILQTRSPR